MEPQKIKRKEITIVKAGLRVDIACIRNNLVTRTTQKLPIPRSIIDGPLSDVIKFKDAAASVCGEYHVSHEPSKYASLKRLSEIKEKLACIERVLCCE